LGETLLKHAMSTETAAPTVETLVAEHTRMVFRIAYSILRSRPDAEDATQECFLRVVKQQHNLHKVRNAKTWLARIAWTTALDKRRSGRETSLDDEGVSGATLMESLRDPGPSADDRLAQQQRQQLLERLIAGLPEELRWPLELSTVEELNSAEIAELMEIPEASVRTRLFRARRQLKEKLAAFLETKPHD